MQGHFSICLLLNSNLSKIQGLKLCWIHFACESAVWGLIEQLRGLSRLRAEAGGWSPPPPALRALLPWTVRLLVHLVVGWSSLTWSCWGHITGTVAWLLVSAQLGGCISRRRVPGAEGEMGKPRGVLWPAGTEQHPFRLRLRSEVSCLDPLRFRGGTSDSFQWEDREHAGVFWSQDRCFEKLKTVKGVSRHIFWLSCARYFFSRVTY